MKSQLRNKKLRQRKSKKLNINNKKRTQRGRGPKVSNPDKALPIIMNYFDKEEHIGDIMKEDDDKFKKLLRISFQVPFCYFGRLKTLIEDYKRIKKDKDPRQTLFNQYFKLMEILLYITQGLRPTISIETTDKTLYEKRDSIIDFLNKKRDFLVAISSDDAQLSNIRKTYDSFIECVLKIKGSINSIKSFQLYSSGLLINSCLQEATDRCVVSLSLDDFNDELFKFNKEQLLTLRSFNIMNSINPIADIMLKKWIDVIAQGNLDHVMVVEYLLSYFEMCKQFTQELKLDVQYVDTLMEVIKRIDFTSSNA